MRSTKQPNLKGTIDSINTARRLDKERAMRHNKSLAPSKPRNRNKSSASSSDFKSIILKVNKACMDAFFTDESLVEMRNLLNDVLYIGSDIIDSSENSVQVFEAWDKFVKYVSIVFSRNEIQRRIDYVLNQLSQMNSKVNFAAENSGLWGNKFIEMRVAWSEIQKDINALENNCQDIVPDLPQNDANAMLKKLTTALEKLHHNFMTDYTPFFNLIVPDRSERTRVVYDCCYMIKQAISAADPKTNITDNDTKLRKLIISAENDIKDIMQEVKNEDRQNTKATRKSPRESLPASQINDRSNLFKRYNDLNPAGKPKPNQTEAPPVQPQIDLTEITENGQNTVDDSKSYISGPSKATSRRNAKEEKNEYIQQIQEAKKEEEELKKKIKQVKETPTKLKINRAQLIQRKSFGVNNEIKTNNELKELKQDVQNLKREIADLNLQLKNIHETGTTNQNIGESLREENYNLQELCESITLYNEFLEKEIYKIKGYNLEIKKDKEPDFKGDVICSSSSERNGSDFDDIPQPKPFPLSSDSGEEENVPEPKLNLIYSESSQDEDNGDVVENKQQNQSQSAQLAAENQRMQAEIEILLEDNEQLQSELDELEELYPSEIQGVSELSKQIQITAMIRNLIMDEITQLEYDFQMEDKINQQFINYVSCHDCSEEIKNFLHRRIEEMKDYIENYQAIKAQVTKVPKSVREAKIIDVSDVSRSTFLKLERKRDKIAKDMASINQVIAHIQETSAQAARRERQLDSISTEPVQQKRNLLTRISIENGLLRFKQEEIENKVALLSRKCGIVSHQKGLAKGISAIRNALIKSQIVPK